MARSDSISLNFLPLITKSVSFTVYRKPDSHEVKASFPTTVHKYSLPVGLEDLDKRKLYWVSLTDIDGFEVFQCDKDHNQYLTREFLLKHLVASCKEAEAPISFREEFDFTGRRVSFTLNHYEEGEEIVWLQSYYLKSERQFGFLIDFHFRKKRDVPFSRRVQQLSLSLDSKGRENKNYYSDRYDKVGQFISKYFRAIFPLPHGDQPIKVSEKLIRLDASALDKKRYVFCNGQSNDSQFTGIKSCGPFSSLVSTPTIFFVYRQQDRLLSLDLYRALRGETFPNIFPGTEKMFGFSLTPQNLKGIAVSDFRIAEMERVRNIARSKIADGPVLVVLIAPWNDEDQEDSQEYFIAKHTFVSAQIPSQVVRLYTLEQDSRLKWSASNIALQSFAKLGGKPWIVQPKHGRCLIIGLGQSHRENYSDEKRQIEKYYAYSVLTDSTGLFKELRVLGCSDDSTNYLKQLRSSIQRIVEEHSESYDRFVIHVPYKIRKRELNSVRQVLDEFGGDDHQFVVLKINSDNDFFGYSDENNSLVPFESTYISLARDEFLVWFEGLQYHNPKVARRYSRPVHIEFHYTSTTLSDNARIEYLQDTVNLSGANWRGFNAKNLPVSIYYAQLIARFTKRFDELGLPEVSVDNLNPWFL
jgi:Piwi domain